MQFQIYKTNNEWRWRLCAANKQIIASGEGYKNRRDCLDVIKLVKNSGEAPILRKKE